LSGDRQIEKLKQQLRAKEEYLQAANEELETANEELSSSNEEMQSVNEELQSTNEELETSREELQSINEELSTVNMELQAKVTELSRLNNDMNNMLTGTGIATVFVDVQMRILRYTPNATEIINLIQSDVGRPVSHLVSNLAGYDSLVEDVQGVLNTLVFKEVDVQTKGGKWFTMRIQPYRTLDNAIEGAVITFVDITEKKYMRDALAVSELRFRRLFETAKDGILILDAETGRIENVNKIMTDMLGYSEEQLIMKKIWDLGFFRDIIANREKFQELQEKEYIRYDNLPLETVDGNSIDVEFISSVYTINQKKIIQCAIREANKRKPGKDSNEESG
jgi:two-component system CheB/CheR fusion protein